MSSFAWAFAFSSAAAAFRLVSAMSSFALWVASARISFARSSAPLVISSLATSAFARSSAFLCIWSASRRAVCKISLRSATIAFACISSPGRLSFNFSTRSEMSSPSTRQRPPESGRFQHFSMSSSSCSIYSSVFPVFKSSAGSFATSGGRSSPQSSPYFKYSRTTVELMCRCSGSEKSSNVSASPQVSL